jgi:hypothetical protein
MPFLAVGSPSDQLHEAPLAAGRSLYFFSCPRISPAGYCVVCTLT